MSIFQVCCRNQLPEISYKSTHATQTSINLMHIWVPGNRNLEPNTFAEFKCHITGHKDFKGLQNISSILQ